MKKATTAAGVENKTLKAMISIYCRKQHKHPGSLCEDCSKLLDYALSKAERCTFGKKKPNCSHCPIHCYEPAMRGQIQKVMRFAGPLMLRYHPLLALIHIARRLRKKPSREARLIRNEKGFEQC